MNIKQKLILVYFIILPFIDLGTSLMTRFTDLPFSLGTLIKGVTLLVCVLYVVFFSKSKHVKKGILYFWVLALFAMLYFLLKKDLWSIGIIINEINIAVKYLYFPIMLICTYIIFYDFKIDNKFIKKILIINCLSYSMLILVPYITGTSFNSYYLNYKEGTNGWFYAANEIGAIISILSVSIYNLMDNNKKWKILICIPIIYSTTLIGTKLSIFGLIIIVLLILLCYIIKNKKQRFLLPTILFLILLICTLNSSSTNNIYKSIEQTENEIVDKVDKNTSINSNDKDNSKDTIDKNIFKDIVDKNNETDKDDNPNNNIIYKNIDDLIENNTIKKIIKVLFNGRENFFLKNYAIYKNSGINNILFGLSWSDRESINYIVVDKLIEIDFLDILIHYGIIGFLIYFIPLIYVLVYIVKKIKKIKTETFLYIMTILMSLAMSCFAGHILGAPAVSIYIIILLVMVINDLNKENSDI